jgi:dTDP-4-dehydrorhamnose 3,5-epimerase
MTTVVDDLSVTSTPIDRLFVVQPKRISDERGAVREFFRWSSAEAFGGSRSWQQINVTETSSGAIRGLHGEPMTKLVGVVAGEAFGAYVDARPDSASRGSLVTVPLVLGTQVLVPPGVLNGFQAVAPGATQYLYCFDQEWQSDMGGPAVHPLDPALAIPWPIEVDPTDRSLLSAKDAALPLLAEVLATLR